MCRGLVSRRRFDDIGVGPGTAQNIMLIGIGCGSFDSTVPVTAMYSVLSSLKIYFGS